MNETNRPKIGIALSGASGRAIAHIGVLEVLREHQIPIDVIVGCSSGALIGASYGVGTMDRLKAWFRDASPAKLLKLWSMRNAKGALFHMHDEETERQLNTITKDMKIEDIKNIRLGFSTTDLNTGELFTITSGSINRAFKASVAVPGLFEPVIWGRKLLVDGGLVNIVPTQPAKDLGADIVIGVNIAATPFILSKTFPIWRSYRFITRVLGLQFLREKIIPAFSFLRFESQSDVINGEVAQIPGLFSVLAKSLDWSEKFERQWKESDQACDLMIEPKVKHYGKADFNSLEKIYQEGRRSAQVAVVQIRKLIENYDRQFETNARMTKIKRKTKETIA